jgi:hypothetical protein
MMDDAIEINIKLGEKEISAAADRIEKKLRAALGPLFGGGPGGGRDPITPRLRDQEAAALRLAQAQARLASVNGNLSQAQNLLSTALDKTTKETVAQINAQIQLVRVNQQMQRETQQSAAGVNSLGSAIGSLRSGFAAFAALGVVSLFVNFGRAALDAAISVDRQVNTLKALTGSAAEAQRRFQELFKLAQQTPGLTTSIAATLDAQLRVFSVNEQTINKLLPVVGRLNAIAPLSDPRQFVNNLTQLISQNFERQDLKELINQSPLAGQLIRQIFDVDNPTNAKAIREAAKRLGITTMERFAEELAKAGENNQALNSVVETIGGRFDKLRDRATLALAPIGKEIADFLIPTLEKLIPLAEDFGNTLSQHLRENRDEIAQFRNAIVELSESFAALGKISIPILGQIAQAAANGIGFWSDVVNIFRGDTSFKNSRANFGNFFRQNTDPQLFTGPEDAEAGGITGAGFGSPGFRTFADFMASRPISSGGSGGGGFGGSGSREKTELEKLQEQTKRAEERVKGLQNDTSKLVQEKLKLLQLKFREEQIDKALEDKAFRALLISQGKPLPPQLPDVGITDAQRRAIPLAPALGSPGAIAGRPTITFQQDIDADAGRAARNNAELLNARVRVQEAQIQNQVTQGLLTEAEARQRLNAARAASRDELIALLEQERNAVGLSSLRGLQITEEIEQMRLLGVELSNTERFMRGFNSQIEDSGAAFERFGQNVSRALTDTKNLLGSLKQAVRDLFNDLLGQSLQNLIRQGLAPLLGGIAGAFGGPSFAGAAGNIFRTPSTFPSQIAQAFAAAGGGGVGISAPPSISSGIGQFIGASVPRTAGVARGTIDEFIGSAVPRTAGRVGGFFSNIGQSIASAAPFLGLSLGGSLGGQSALGQIAGSAGGFLGGGLLAAKLAPGLLSKGAAAFFTNPFTIAIGAGLLVGSVLLGRAAQRRKDEEASGQFLTQALQGIEELAAGVANGQIPGSQARQIFENQILGTFRQQVSGLKTRSVVESRLTNQVADLRRVFEARIPPLIAEQERKAADAARFAAIDSRLVPQFAGGGTVPGIDRGRDSVLAMVRPGEKILTLAQQSSVIAQSNPGVFDRAGVPRTAIQAGAAQAFQFGGTAQPSSFWGASGTPMVDTLIVEVDFDAEGMVRAGLKGRNGEDIVARKVEARRRRRRNS